MKYSNIMRALTKGCCVSALLCCASHGQMSSVKTVFIILMENHNWSQIKGSASAPYINNTLLPMSSYATQYFNPPGIHPSLPNYLWLEAGTGFGITNDNDPATNHQSTTSHLATQLATAGITWKSYQENISGTTCPLTSVSLYAPKHNPFVYFDDVTNTNNANSATCLTHVRPYSELATDIANNTVPQYVFITPNLCNDMHDSCSPLNNPVQQGDTWLSTEVPRILNSAAYRNGGALFVTWDEGVSGDGPIGMIVVSSLAKGGGYNNAIHYTHGSTLRSFEEIFGVPLIRDAVNQTSLSDLFKPAAPPPAPSGVSATAGNAQVTLAWNVVSGASTYNVKRGAAAGGPYGTVATVSTNAYTDTGLTDGTTYYYVISAVNVAGEGPNSAEVNATPQPSLPPAPTNLQATGGNAQVSLTWNAVSGAVSYNLKRSTTSGGPYATIASGITVPSATDKPVANGTTYYYVVSGVNGAGEGPNSQQASATPAATPTAVYQVNVGGLAASPYQEDAFFNGGQPASTTTSIDLSGVANPAPQAVYQTWREGAKKAPSFTYTFSNLTVNGAYTVRLHFSENELRRVGARKFNVSINRTQVLGNFDVFATAGAQFKATVQTFTATATDGQIAISFDGVTASQGPIVNGVEILR
jgi:phosphatidylinositol-3-phosphatase